MATCLSLNSEELIKLAEELGVQVTPAFADKVGNMIDKQSTQDLPKFKDEQDAAMAVIDEAIKDGDSVNINGDEYTVYDKEDEDIKFIKVEPQLPTAEQFKAYTEQNKPNENIVVEDGKAKVKQPQGLDHMEVWLPAWMEEMFAEQFRNEDGDVDFKKVNDVLPELMDMIGFRIPTEDKYSVFPMKATRFLPSTSGGAIMMPSEITVISGMDFDVDKVYVAFKEIIRARGGKMEVAKYLTEENSTLQERKLAYLSRTDEGKKIKAESRVEIKKISEDIDIAKKAQEESGSETSKELQELYKNKDALYAKRDEAILKLMPDEEFSKIPIEEQNTVAARNNRLIDITLGVMRNPSTAEAIFTPGGYDYLKDTVHKDITEAMAQGVGKVRKATNMFDADDVDLMTYQNIAGRDLKGIAASHNKFRALIEHSNLKMVNPFLFNGKKLSDLSGKSSKGLDTSGGKISRNVSEILAASVDNGKDPLLADINYSQHTAEIIFMMLSSGVPSKTVFAFINQKPVRDAMQMVFLGDANNLEDALKTIFKKVNSGNPYSSSKVKPVNFDEQDLIDDINSESLVHTRNVVGSLLKYIEYSKDFSKIIRASKADTNGVGKFVEEGLTLLKAMKDAIAAEAKPNEDGIMTGNITGIKEFLSGLKDNDSTVRESDSTINIYAGTGENAEFSNFAIRPFKTNVELENGSKEFSFKSVEQAFHFHKAVVANNPQVGKKILETTNGATLRNLTNRYNLPMTPKQVNDWDLAAKSVMLNLMYDSYLENPDAAQRLVNTGNAKITHNQDNTRWKKDFPEVVETVRGMLVDDGYSAKTTESNRTNPNKMTQAFTKYGVELPMEEVFEKMYPYSKSLFKSVKAKIGEIAKSPLSAEENRDINDHLIQFLTSDYQFYSVGNRKEFVRKVVADFKKLKANNQQLFAENAMLRTISTPYDKTLEMNILKFDNSVTLSQEQVQDIYEGFAELYKPADDSYVEESENIDLSKIDYSGYTNYSGAAQGGDSEWARIGKAFGLGKQVDYRPQDLSKLTKEQLQEVENAYQKAVIDLGRKPLDANTFAGGLVRRDYLQAKAADEVFAIGVLVKPGERDPKGYLNKTNNTLVAGGTGYAVQMAINLGKPVHVFDQSTGKWFINSNGLWTEESTPKLSKKFAGIGTREINQLGINAIESVYASSSIGVNKKSTEAQLFDLARDIIRYSYIMTGHKYAPSSVKTVIPHDIYLQIGDEIGVSITDKMNDIMKMEEDRALEDRFIDQYIRNNSSNTKIVPKLPEDKDGLYKTSEVDVRVNGVRFDDSKNIEGVPSVYDANKEPIVNYITMQVETSNGRENRLYKFSESKSTYPSATFIQIGKLGSPGQVYEYGVNIGYSNNESIIESNNISSGEAEAENQTNNCNIAR
jgi:predicted NAD-dependent protein-ADP-ribosyltransferase YbiA (DUF1768 family)